MAIAAMTLKMTGVTGESAADRHVGEIDVVSWGWGLQSAPYALYDGAPGGASSFNELALVKRVDRSTVTLFQFCDGHSVIGNATLTVQKASGADLIDYFTVVMDKVRIVNVEVRSEEAELREHLRLSAETVTINYTPQSDLGTPASGPISYTADKSPK
jgi:type VI secretion system secreted protein Hcp